MYRTFLSLINEAILSFIEERENALAPEIAKKEEPAPSGIAFLRECLRRMTGSADPRIIEVCSRARTIQEEVRNASKFDLPSDIYVHYVFLRDRRPESGVCI
jgi:hypothetical protein